MVFLSGVDDLNYRIIGLLPLNSIDQQEIVSTNYGHVNQYHNSG